MWIKSRDWNNITIIIIIIMLMINMNNYMLEVVVVLINAWNFHIIVDNMDLSTIS